MDRSSALTSVDPMNGLAERIPAEEGRWTSSLRVLVIGLETTNGSTLRRGLGRGRMVGVLARPWI
jgi:hypothetical protein